MNEQIELARRYVEQTGTSLFLTGKAGTGKTTFLRDIDEHCPKRHLVVAPTGVAAVNAGGVTIHSFFQLPFDPYLPDVKELVTEYQMPDRFKSLSKTKLDIIRTLELLIIDEVSMVRADLLDAVDMTLRRLRRSGRPFGGVQLLMIGDVHQLPPVVTERERPYMERVYPSPFFFHSKALQQLPYVTVELTHVYRQQDASFVDLLNRVRNNAIDPQTLAALNARVLPASGEARRPGEGQGGGEAITLTTHNYQADAINRAHMQALQGDSRLYEAEVQGNFPETMYPVDARLELKVGERVMFVKNDSSGARRYYNGKLATLTGFTTVEDKELVEVIDDDGDTILVGHEVWENLKYSIDSKSGAIEQVVDGRFGQYPLRAAWAVTIHKAQGLTFDRVRINAADAFAFGQVYVALSRCRSLEGLTLTTPLSASVTFGDRDVQQFCDAQPTFEQTREAVADAERQYYYDQLAELFSVEGLLKDLERVVSVFAKVRLTYPKQYDALIGAGQQMADLAAVSERFRNQLMRLPSESHADRIAKGTAFYLQQLLALQTGLKAVLDVEVDNQETSRQLLAARESLDEHLGIKVACLQAVDKQGYGVAVVQKARTDYLLGGSKGGAGKGKRRAAASKSPKAAPKGRKEEPKDDLLLMLRTWRNRKAADENVAPYMVLQQKAMLTIAEAMPTDYDTLGSLQWVGPKTVERFGKEILDIVADYREANGIVG